MTTKLLLLGREARRFFRPTGFYFRSPTKFLQKRIGFSFERVGNEFTEDGRKFKSMSAISGCDD